MNSAKTAYRILCSKEPSIPIFNRAWWLDAAAGEDNWDVALVEQDESIVAALPYVIKKKFGLTLLTQPSLTQTLGPWLKEIKTTHAREFSIQKELMQALIDQLPPYDHYIQNWHHSQTNWLPFYWAGFTQTTRYSYVIDDIDNIENVYSGFSHGKRKEIRIAEKNINIRFDISAEELYENHKEILAKQKKEISYSYKLFKKLYDSGYKNEAARTIAGYDNEGNLHAALFIVWDENSAYGLISTIDPSYRGSGAASLLTLKMIDFLSGKTKKFDFEGSMIESLAASYRQYNTRQAPYFSVSKTPSKLYAAAKLILSLRRSSA